VVADLDARDDRPAPALGLVGAADGVLVRGVLELPEQRRERDVAQADPPSVQEGT